MCACQHGARWIPVTLEGVTVRQYFFALFRSHLFWTALALRYVFVVLWGRWRTALAGNEEISFWQRALVPSSRQGPTRLRCTNVRNETNDACFTRHPLHNVVFSSPYMIPSSIHKHRSEWYGRDKPCRASKKFEIGLESWERDMVYTQLNQLSCHVV